MKITIDIDAKEIAELRALALPEERLVDPISAHAKKQLVDEIVGDITDAVKAATTYRTVPLTYEPTNIMPADKITVPIELDTTPLGTAQKKADKLKATLLEVQELIHRPNIEYEIQSEVRAFVQTAELVKKICTAHKDANIKIKIKLGY